jgi:mono/diheme cytochrome c family protein
MKLLTAFILGSISLPLLIVLVGVLGYLPSSATSAPPGIEASIGMRALDASLEHRSKGLKNPIAANDKAALAAGAKLYADGCAGCHGDAKAPSAWGSKGFYPRVPQFWQEGSDVTPEEAYAAIHDGIRYSGMGAWRDIMKPDDMWKVANFVASIRAPGGKKMDKDRN